MWGSITSLSHCDSQHRLATSQAREFQGRIAKRAKRSVSEVLGREAAERRTRRRTFLKVYISYHGFT